MLCGETEKRNEVSPWSGTKDVAQSWHQPQKCLSHHPALAWINSSFFTSACKNCKPTCDWNKKEVVSSVMIYC